MVCKSMRSTRFYWGEIFSGVVFAIFGIISASLLRESSHDMSRIVGIFTGIGASITGVGVARLIHLKITSPEKLKKEQINLKDERNVQILRISYSISNIVAVLLFASLVLLFSALGSTRESYICLGAMLIQQVAFGVAYKYYSKKI